MHREAVSRQAGIALLGSQASVGRFACFYPPEAAARARSELELKIAAVEGRFESEGWRARRDCSRFWAHLVLMALRDHDGELRGFGHVIRRVPQPRCAQALQGAACHACMFLPETSCERGNKYLDRSVLVPTVERSNLAFFPTMI